MPVPPVYAALEIPQGTTWPCRWRISDPDSGEPVDLAASGWSARGQVRSTPDDDTVLHEWTSTGSNLDLGADGTLVITVTPAESTAWTWRTGVYDVELTDPAGRVTRIAEGTVSVSREITR